MHVEDLPVEASSPSRGWGASVAGAGGAVLATLASACCVPVLAPLLVSVLGVSGAVWAAGFEPYAVPILAAAGACLSYGFWTVLRRGPAPEGAACPRERPRAVLAVLWSAAAVWLLALALNVVRFS